MKKINLSILIFVLFFLGCFQSLVVKDEIKYRPQDTAEIILYFEEERNRDLSTLNHYERQTLSDNYRWCSMNLYQFGSFQDILKLKEYSKIENDILLNQIIESLYLISVFSLDQLLQYRRNEYYKSRVLEEKNPVHPNIYLETFIEICKSFKDHEDNDVSKMARNAALKFAQSFRW